jgi:hypothetical protein
MITGTECIGWPGCEQAHTGSCSIVEIEHFFLETGPLGRKENARANNCLRQRAVVA